MRRKKETSCDPVATPLFFVLWPLIFRWFLVEEQNVSFFFIWLVSFYLYLCGCSPVVVCRTQTVESQQVYVNAVFYWSAAFLVSLLEPFWAVPSVEAPPSAPPHRPHSSYDILLLDWWCGLITDCTQSPAIICCLRHEAISAIQQVSPPRVISISPSACCNYPLAGIAGCEI